MTYKYGCKKSNTNRCVHTIKTRLGRNEFQIFLSTCLTVVSRILLRLSVAKSGSATSMISTSTPTWTQSWSKWAVLIRMLGEGQPWSSWEDSGSGSTNSIVSFSSKMKWMEFYFFVSRQLCRLFIFFHPAHGYSVTDSILDFSKRVRIIKDKFEHIIFMVDPMITERMELGGWAMKLGRKNSLG